MNKIKDILDSDDTIKKLDFLDKDPMNIEFFENQDEFFQIKAVIKNPLAILFIKNPTNSAVEIALLKMPALTSLFNEKKYSYIHQKLLKNNPSILKSLDIDENILKIIDKENIVSLDFLESDKQIKTTLSYLDSNKDRYKKFATLLSTASIKKIKELRGDEFLIKNFFPHNYFLIKHLDDKYKEDPLFFKQLIYKNPKVLNLESIYFSPNDKDDKVIKNLKKDFRKIADRLNKQDNDKINFNDFIKNSKSNQKKANPSFYKKEVKKVIEDLREENNEIIDIIGPHFHMDYDKYLKAFKNNSKKAELPILKFILEDNFLKYEPLKTRVFFEDFLMRDLSWLAKIGKPFQPHFFKSFLTNNFFDENISHEDFSIKGLEKMVKTTRLDSETKFPSTFSTSFFTPCLKEKEQVFYLISYLNSCISPKQGIHIKEEYGEIKDNEILINKKANIFYRFALVANKKHLSVDIVKYLYHSAHKNFPSFVNKEVLFNEIGDINKTLSSIVSKNPQQILKIIGNKEESLFAGNILWKDFLNIYSINKDLLIKEALERKPSLLSFVIDKIDNNELVEEILLKYPPKTLDDTIKISNYVKNEVLSKSILNNKEDYNASVALIAIASKNSKNITKDEMIRVINKSPSSYDHFKKYLNKEDLINFIDVREDALKDFNIKDFTQEDFKKIVKKNGLTIKHIKDPSNEIINLAFESAPEILGDYFEKLDTRRIYKKVEKNPYIIEFLQSNETKKNIKQKLEKIALLKEPLSIFKIDNPSKKQIKLAIKNNPDSFQYIINCPYNLKQKILTKFPLCAIKNENLNYKEEIKAIKSIEKKKKLKGEDLYLKIRNPKKETLDYLIVNYPKTLKHINVEIDDKIAREAVKKNIDCFTYLDNPKPLTQLEAILQNKNLIKFIKNPTDEAKKTALSKDPNLIKYLYKNNLSDEKLRKQYLSTHPIMIKDIKNPNPSLQKEAVNHDPFLINYIKNPTTATQKIAIEDSLTNIEYINNPHPKIRKEVLKQDPSLINILINKNSYDNDDLILSLFSNPHVFKLLTLKDNDSRMEIAQLKYVKADPNNFFNIKNPKEKTTLLAASLDPNIILKIKNPNKNLQKIFIDKNITNITLLEKHLQPLKLEEDILKYAFKNDIEVYMKLIDPPLWMEKQYLKKKTKNNKKNVR